MDQTTTTRVRYVIQEHVHQANPVVGPVLEMIVDVTASVMVILFVKGIYVLGVGMTMAARVIPHTVIRVIRRLVTFAILVRQMPIVMLPLIKMGLDCPFATSTRDIVIFVH